MYLARPRPAPEIGDALIVEGDYRDPVAPRARRRQHAPVVSLALQTPYRVAVRAGQEYQDDQRPHEPVFFPERPPIHRHSPVACRRAFFVRRISRPFELKTPTRLTGSPGRTTSPAGRDDPSGAAACSPPSP